MVACRRYPAAIPEYQRRFCAEVYLNVMMVRFGQRTEWLSGKMDELGSLWCGTHWTSCYPISFLARTLILPQALRRAITRKRDTHLGILIFTRIFFNEWSKGIRLRLEPDRIFRALRPLLLLLGKPQMAGSAARNALCLSVGFRPPCASVAAAVTRATNNRSSLIKNTSIVGLYSTDATHQIVTNQWTVEHIALNIGADTL